MQLRVLGARQDWDGMEDLAREKRSPIGFAPFASVARACGAPPAVISRYSGGQCPFVFDWVQFEALWGTPLGLRKKLGLRQ